MNLLYDERYAIRHECHARVIAALNVFLFEKTIAFAIALGGCRGDFALSHAVGGDVCAFAHVGDWIN